MSIRGIDVSDYQPNVDWQAVVDSGISFAFIKATEGETFIAEVFESYWKQAKAKGLLRGAYHFFRPSSHVQGQAYNFLTTVSLEVGDLPPVLDIETTDGLEPERLCDRAEEWLEIVERETGFRPIIYTYPGFWEQLNTQRFADYPLWIAHYTTAEQPIIPGGWKSWLFWQFTDRGTVNGIQGGVDINLFETTRQGEVGPKVEDLQTLLKNRGFDPGVIDGIFGNKTKSAITKFQQTQGLEVDGVANLKTLTGLLGKLKTVEVPEPSPTPTPTPSPTPEPTLDLIEVCQAYQGKTYQDEALNWLQQRLSSEVLLEFAQRWRNQATPQTRSIALIDVCKYYRGLPNQQEAIRWLQQQIPTQTWLEFQQKWQNPQPPTPKPEINLVDVCKFYQGSPNQTAAVEWLQTQIPASTLAEFARRWRNQT